MKKTQLSVAIAALLTCLTQAAQAVCPVDGATPFLAGPADPVNGFSTYVQDSQGLTLQLCLDGDGANGPCFFDPIVAGNAFSALTGFGAEAFWWLANGGIPDAATIGGGNTLASGLSAVLVMGAEAAYGGGEPLAGDQFQFTRLRIRVDTPNLGIYTITTPFGTQEFTVSQIVNGNEINDSQDIQFFPDALGQGRVAPWLTWDTFPGDPALVINGLQYIGDNLTEHAVTGSPCGTNFFRIEARPLTPGGQIPAFDPQDQDGDGSTTRYTSNLFVVSGKLSDIVVATPVSVDAATYTRDSNGRVSVFATAPTTATLTFSGAPNLPAGEQPMASDGSGKFFGSVGLTPDPTSVPGAVQVTADNNGNVNVVVQDVVDEVTITQANYDAATNTLSVAATSSDKTAPLTMDAGALGALSCTGTDCSLSATVSAAPASVTVNSSHGGSATESVIIVNGGL